jgi:hypothetical protein
VSRAALSALALGAMLCAASCVAPLGPGYTIERQRIEITFTSAPQPHVRVRAAWRLKNTGTQPLTTLEVFLPEALRRERSGLHIEVAGREIAPSEVTTTNTVSFAFPSVLARKAKLDVTMSYELAGTPAKPDAESGVVVGPSGFVLPPGDWMPALRPPKGGLSAGGEPPERWEIAASVPAGFRVLASGHARGQEGGVFAFEQRRQSPLPFAAGGAYQEVKVAAEGTPVVFWTRQAMPPEVAQRAADAVARTAQLYDATFGPREADARTLWILECPSAGSCWPVPEAAFAGRELNTPQFWQTGLVAIDRQLAATWLDFRVRASFEMEPLPMGALAHYAAALATIAREGGDARERIVRGLIQNTRSAPKQCQETTIFSVRSLGAGPAGECARWRSELFFFALEDAAGTENLSRALRHLLHAYSVGMWTAADLRSAIEQETGKDFAAFFREWLTEPGIPKEFVARY